MSVNLELETTRQIVIEPKYDRVVRVIIDGVDLSDIIKQVGIDNILQDIGHDVVLDNIGESAAREHFGIADEQ